MERDDPGTRRARTRMVEEQLRRRDIVDERVLGTIAAVPRHAFLPDRLRSWAYEDRPVGIGFGQTISQPYIVAFMTQALQLEGTESVLEVGTGCGYQTAVLAELAGRVFSVESVPDLAERARETLEILGYRNIELRVGDGYEGWPEAAPFDRILVTAAPPSIPEQLFEQCIEGGRMVVPVGVEFQQLYAIDKTGGGREERALLPVRFVPMTHPGPDKGRGR